MRSDNNNNSKQKHDDNDWQKPPLLLTLHVLPEILHNPAIVALVEKMIKLTDMHYILDKVKSSKIARFVISGGTAAASLFLTLYILKEIFHVWYLAASIIAFCVSICINFAFQKFWVFQKHTTEKIHKESAYFLGLSLFNLLLNSGLMYLFVDKAHMNYILSQFIIAILLAIWNFVLYGFIFKDEPVPTPYA